MGTNEMHRRDLFPALTDFPEAVTDVACVPEDVQVLRLVSKVQNLMFLSRLSRLERLWCFDLNAKSIPLVGRLANLRRLYVDGIRLDSLGALRNLTGLEVLSLERCTQITSLEELSRFDAVQGLALTHFPKVHSLRTLERFLSVKALAVAGGMWTRMTVESLAPLAALADLRFLHLANLMALDKSLEPLAALTALSVLELPNFYPVEEFAKLSAHLKNTDCDWFSAFIPVDSVHCPKCGQESMVMLTGKGTTMVCKICEETRLRKHDDVYRNIAARTA
jgi:hypothetical protein